MSSVEFGPNGSVVKDDPATLDRIKQELAQREHAYPDGRPRPVRAFADFARIALIVWCVELGLQMLLVAGYFFASDSLPGMFYEIGGNENLNLGVMSDWLIFLTAITAFVLVGRFTYRAQKNLFTIGSPYAKMPPGWTVGWYFIPFAALWQPVMGMIQIYRGSHAAVGERDTSLTLVLVWWGGWILMNVPDWFVLLWQDSLMMQFLLLAASSGLGVLAALSLIRILARVSRCQEMLLRGGVATVFD
jgi:hypothetical protein